MLNTCKAKGAFVNAQNRLGETPLHQACMQRGRGGSGPWVGKKIPFPPSSPLLLPLASLQSVSSSLLAFIAFLECLALLPLIFASLLLTSRPFSDSRIVVLPDFSSLSPPHSFSSRPPRVVSPFSILLACPLSSVLLDILVVWLVSLLSYQVEVPFLQISSTGCLATCTSTTS